MAVSVVVVVGAPSGSRGGFEVLQDDLDDLSWFFSGAEAEFGLRSCQGGFEAQMKLRAYCVGTGEIHVQETRASQFGDSIGDRQVDAATRYAGIKQRLSRLSRETNLILELHHGDSIRIAGVGVSLLAATQTAIVGMTAWSKRVRKNTKDKLPECAFDNLRSFVVGLSAMKRQASAHLLGEILSEAQTDLGKAHEEYASTGDEDVRAAS